MSSLAAFAATMTIESQDIELQMPDKPKDSSENISGQRLGFPLDFEMQPMPIRHMSSGPGDVAGTFDDPESRRVSNDENRNTDGPGPVSEQVQTIWHPYKNRFRLMAACLTAMANGMNDSAPGALIASLERYESPKIY
jgi:hypothetical protein